jgi:ParB family chromosome partitioning protein
MKDEVRMISIDRIRILNPRFRDPKKFALIVQSIRNLGLKKPIQVSLRAKEEAEGPGYDLVCGQGRIEAFVALGHKEIPAVVVEVTKEERLLLSLVENMARRFSSPLELLSEIVRLKACGYNNNTISTKLDMDDQTVGGLLALEKAGEKRLLEAALSGKLPLSIAIEIARTEGAEMQRELLRGYESKQLNQVSIRVVKRIMDQRRLLGKDADKGGKAASKTRTSAESLVSAYRRESQKQKLMVKKGKVCDAKLLFVVTAFGELLDDENFVTLLRAESLLTIPKPLASRLTTTKEETR